MTTAPLPLNTLALFPNGKHLVIGGGTFKSVTNIHEVPIILLLSWSDKKHLRSTCRTLNFALEPLVLSHLVIDPKRTTLEQLKLLASVSYEASSFVKSIKIEKFLQDRPRMEVKEDTDTLSVMVMRGALVPALASLTNSQAVNSDLDSRDPTDSWIQILEDLTSLSVANVEMKILETLPRVVTFDLLHDLRSISISMAGNGLHILHTFPCSSGRQEGIWTSAFRHPEISDRRIN
ncbi:hypothetical protein B0H13DRAFT_2328401 [Mycena leptocephala]|nr:hypothetical protein B0H13DRAFT_2328401 [Mycena leptocephala]